MYNPILGVHCDCSMSMGVTLLCNVDAFLAKNRGNEKKRRGIFFFFFYYPPIVVHCDILTTFFMKNTRKIRHLYYTKWIPVNKKAFL